jgi:hypothetical protein
VWSKLDEPSRREVEVWERYADGCATPQELASAVAGWCDPSDIAWSFARGEEAKAQAELLRDLVGNPFRPAALDPSWLTAAVKALAQVIYEERRFADMPVLADALEEAGCTNADILAHCRSGGEHARGCWVVDLILAKR